MSVYSFLVTVHIDDVHASMTVRYLLPSSSYSNIVSSSSLNSAKSLMTLEATKFDACDLVDIIVFFGP